LHKHHTGWVFLVCVILLAGACSDDAPVAEPETKAKSAEQQPDLPVREWYPTPKHAKPRFKISPAQPPAQMPMTQQPSYKAAPVPQQQWNMQPQMQWNGSGQQWQAPVQQPVVPQQYQYVYPQQPEQRPWGSVPNSTQQGTATDYWGTPVYRGGQYNVYPAPGMPGYVW
jgi:hypothetical protein